MFQQRHYTTTQPQYHQWHIPVIDVGGSSSQSQRHRSRRNTYAEPVAQTSYDRAYERTPRPAAATKTTTRGSPRSDSSLPCSSEESNVWTSPDGSTSYGVRTGVHHGPGVTVQQSTAFYTSQPHASGSSRQQATTWISSNPADTFTFVGGASGAPRYTLAETLPSPTTLFGFSAIPIPVLSTQTLPGFFTNEDSAQTRIYVAQEMGDTATRLGNEHQRRREEMRRQHRAFEAFAREELAQSAKMVETLLGLTDDLRRRHEALLDESELEWERAFFEDNGPSRKRWDAERQERQRERRRAEEEMRIQQERDKALRKEKEREIYETVWQVYEERWQALQDGSRLKTGKPLTFSSIPWPVVGTLSEGPSGLTTEQMRSFLYGPVDDVVDPAVTKQRVKDMLLRFHPDRFEGRYMRYVREKDRPMVKDGLGQVIRFLNEFGQAK